MIFMKSKMNFKGIKLTLVIVFMAIIFYMSSKPADESNEISNEVIILLNMLNIHVNDFFGSLASFVVRKIAHFSEYAILVTLIYSYFRENLNKLRSTVYALIISFIYACSDEIHQYFVPGRSMMVRDVIIDTSGAAAALIIIWIIIIYKNYIIKTKTI